MAKLWETLPQTPCLSQGLRQEIKRQDLHSHGGRDPAFFSFSQTKEDASRAALYSCSGSALYNSSRHHFHTSDITDVYSYYDNFPVDGSKAP